MSRGSENVHGNIRGGSLQCSGALKSSACFRVSCLVLAPRHSCSRYGEHARERERQKSREREFENGRDGSERRVCPVLVSCTSYISLTASRCLMLQSDELCSARGSVCTLVSTDGRGSGVSRMPAENMSVPLSSSLKTRETKVSVRDLTALRSKELIPFASISGMIVSCLSLVHVCKGSCSHHTIMATLGAAYGWVPENTAAHVLLHR